MNATKMTASKRARLIASLRDQRLDVHIGIRPMSEYHQNVDNTAKLIAEAGLEPMPADVVTWGRNSQAGA